MQLQTSQEPIPIYSLKPDESGNKQFRVYSFNRDFPDRSEVLLPHRKDYYLLVLIRQGGGRQWIDMTPYSLKDNAIYFMGPDQVIVKEEMVQLTSIGIAFTKDFLTFQENTSIAALPLSKIPEHCRNWSLKKRTSFWLKI